MKLKRPERLALAVAGMALLGSLAAPVATLMVSSDRRPAESCVVIYDHYSDEIAKGPAQREAILPGADGRSVLNDDPDARYCHLTAASFAGAVVVPQPLPSRG
jgi:hypothetical protein